MLNLLLNIFKKLKDIKFLVAFLFGDLGIEFTSTLGL